MRPFGRDVSGHGGLDAANGRFQSEAAVGRSRSKKQIRLLAAIRRNEINRPSIINADDATNELGDRYGHIAEFGFEHQRQRFRT